MAERGVEVDHSTIARWVLHFSPILNDLIRHEMRRPNRSVASVANHIAEGIVARTAGGRSGRDPKQPFDEPLLADNFAFW